MLAMPTAINQTTAIRQSYQLVIVSSRTHQVPFIRGLVGKQETATDGNWKTYSV
jgi:hypothetical protein